MKTSRRGAMLRLYVDENERWHGEPLYHVYLRKIMEMGCAGATITRGIEGFGGHHHLHSARLVSLSDNLPVVIDIVDSPEIIDKALTLFGEMVEDGVAVVSGTVTIHTFANSKKD